jgi:peptide/nickel transport system substrate-binding protein
MSSHVEHAVPESSDSTTLHTIREKLRSFSHAVWNDSSPFERVIVALLCTALALSTLGMIRNMHEALTVEIPTEGGSLTEGMVGSPRFVNPVLAVSETDRALSSLIFSGLMREDAAGKIVPDLAETYTISPDGKVYEFTLKANATFHDGTTITTDDVLYTIDRTRDPVIKSPRRADWEGVNVEKKDERTVRFVLQKPYAPFLHNTTIGIIPKSQWKDLTPEEFAFSNKNIAPVGSGPYTFSSVSENSQGVPSSYALHVFSKYEGQKPYIQDIIVNFYHSESDAIDALKSGYVEALGGLSPKDATDLAREYPTMMTATLPRVFALFFNQVKSVALADHAVREALLTAVDRKQIITDTFQGYAIPLDGPLPSDSLSEDETDGDRAQLAAKILDDAGWKLDSATNTRVKDKKELVLSIATANTAELKDVAQRVADSWRAAGVKVKVELFETGDLNQLMLRPRAFDVLLFGEITGRDPDLFAFWHSSQKSDPGLNVAQYQNKKADALLEKARSTTDEGSREKAYNSFKQIIQDDVPAIFLYAPQYVYVLPKDIHGASFPGVMEPYERYTNISSWYRESERVWSIFARNYTRTENN